MYNHNKAQQSKNRVNISWDILYLLLKKHSDQFYIWSLAAGQYFRKIRIRNNE